MRGYLGDIRGKESQERGGKAECWVKGCWLLISTLLLCMFENGHNKKLKNKIKKLRRMVGGFASHLLSKVSLLSTGIRLLGLESQLCLFCSVI